jgi:hypothetical protein
MGHTAHIWNTENMYDILAEKSDMQILLGRPYFRQEDINMDTKEYLPQISRV